MPKARETQKKSLSTVSTDKRLSSDFALKEKANELDGVTLTYEMPITVKGDTIVYVTNAFTTR